MFKKISRTLTVLFASTLMFSVSGDSYANKIGNVQELNPVNGIVYDLSIDTINIKKVELCIPEKTLKNKYSTGWATTSVNVRKSPSTKSKILDTYSFNDKVHYTDYDENWIEIKYKDSIAYMYKDYISKTKRAYKEFDVPSNSGFKSFMDYRCITAVGSKQYQLQHSVAYTGNYGIRQINGRYCVAIGSYFTTEIGTYFDLILANGTVISCILGDAKADQDTDSSNIITEHNGCLSEFIVDTPSLYSEAKRMGNISYCDEDWNSPVVKIRVYEED